MPNYLSIYLLVYTLFSVWPHCLRALSSFGTWQAVLSQSEAGAGHEKWDGNFGSHNCRRDVVVHLQILAFQIDR